MILHPHHLEVVPVSMYQPARRTTRPLTLVLFSVVILFSIAIFAGVILADVAAQSDEAAIRLETTPASGEIGDTFTTQIYADGVPAPGLGSWQVVIDYDPAILAVDTVTFGADLYATGRTKLLELSNLKEPGTAWLTQVTSGTGIDGPVGNGLHLVTITWKAVGGGVSDILLAPSERQRLVDINNTPFAPLKLVESKVTVNPGEATPTPTTSATPTPTATSVPTSTPTATQEPPLNLLFLPLILK